MKRINKTGLGLLTFLVFLFGATLLNLFIPASAQAATGAGCTFTYTTEAVSANDPQYGAYAGRDFLFVNISGANCDVTPAGSGVTRLKLALSGGTINGAIDEYGEENANAIFNHATVNTNIIVVRNNNFANPELGSFPPDNPLERTYTPITISSPTTAQNFIANNGDTNFEEPPPTTPDSETDTAPPSCEGSIDNGFGWIICPGLRLIDNFMGGAERVIESKLRVDETFGMVEGQPADTALRGSWIQMARVASGLLVVIGLVMIISTALGFDFVSTYTVKKVLPRLVLGALGIWLSWTILTTYISLMNDLGAGIAAFMYAPFQTTFNLPFESVTLEAIAARAASTSGVVTDMATLGIFAGLAAGALVGGGGISILGIVAAAIPVAGALLIGLFVLALREVVIIFLVVISPLAFAAWILPNTNKVWKMWENSLNKLLLMYPLFMAIFAAGKIFAVISSQAAASNSGTGFVEVIIPMLAYVAPLFFLPFLFKFAGGLFGQITGMVNDKSKGAFDKMSGSLKERRKADVKRRGDYRQKTAGIRMAAGEYNPGVRGRVRRARDRWTLGGGIGAVSPASRAADREERQRQLEQGWKAAEERRRYETGNIPAGPTTRRADESLAAYQARVQSEAQERGIAAGAADATINAEEVKLQGDIDAHLQNPNMQVDKAQLNVDKAMDEAQTWRPDIAQSEQQGERIKQEAANTAHDEYAQAVRAGLIAGTIPLGAPVTGDLAVDKAVVSAEGIEASTRMFDQQSALTEIQVKEMVEAAKRAFDAARIETIVEAEAKQEIYARLAQLGDGVAETIVNPITNERHVFTGSEAVRQTALTQMLKGGMFEDKVTLGGAAAPGLSDGSGGGILETLRTGSPQHQATAQRFIAENFGDIKEKTPDIVGTTDLSTLSAEAVTKLHPTRQAEWRRQFIANTRSGSFDEVGRTMSQFNDLANPNLQRQLKPEFFTRLYDDLAGSGMPAADIDDVRKVINSGGKQYFDETGTVRLRP